MVLYVLKGRASGFKAVVGGGEGGFGEARKIETLAEYRTLRMRSLFGVHHASYACCVLPVEIRLLKT